MRILVFGAGVLGCNLAHCLFKAQKDVTLLARGDWYQTIKEHGLTIANKLPPSKTNDRIRVISILEPDDIYDIIFVVARYTQLKDIITTMNQNKSQLIVLVGNNTAAREYAQTLEGKEVLFGFASSAGHREKNKVVSVNMSSMTIGTLDGTTEYRDRILQLFSGMKYKLNFCEKMDDWLKAHAAFVLPAAFACYYTNGNLKLIKRDTAFRNKIIDAVLEAYEALSAAGYQILPEGSYEYVKERKKFMRFLKICCATFVGKIIASDHAMSAADEMTALHKDLIKLMQESGSKTPVYNELATYLPKSL